MRGGKCSRSLRTTANSGRKESAYEYHSTVNHVALLSTVVAVQAGQAGQSVLAASGTALGWRDHMPEARGTFCAKLEAHNFFKRTIEKEANTLY